MNLTNKYLNIRTYTKPAQGLLVAALLLTASTSSAEPVYAQESDSSNQIMLPLIQNGETTSNGLSDGDEAGPFNAANIKWAKHSDDKYHFQIDYPEGWHLSAATDELGSVTQIVHPDIVLDKDEPSHDREVHAAELQSGVGKIEIGVLGMDKPTDVDMQTWIGNPTLQDNKGTVSHTTVAGVKSLQVAYQSIHGDGVQYMIPNGTKVYFINVMPASAVENDSMKQMLNSFNVVGKYAAEQQVATTLQPEIAEIDARVESGGAVRAAAVPQYRLPFVGKYIITAGPGCFYTHWGPSREAIDFGMPLNHPVRAAESGTVVYSGWNTQGYGNLVKIQHSDGTVSYYAHLNYLNTRYRAHVQKGQIIGHSGATGNVTGVHLHFEVRSRYNQPVNVRTMTGIAWYSHNPSRPCWGTKWQPDGVANGSTVTVYSPIAQNILTASGRKYELGECKVGGKMYTDRNYKFTKFSNSDYQNRPCIITANNDKNNDSPKLLKFELKRPATIRIMIDRRMDRKPSWLGNKYTKNSKKVYTTDGNMKYFEVYTCEAKPGWITLGGPQRGSKGVESMYVVQIKEVSKGRTNCSTP